MGAGVEALAGSDVTRVGPREGVLAGISVGELYVAGAVTPHGVEEAILHAIGVGGATTGDGVYVLVGSERRRESQGAGCREGQYQGLCREHGGKQRSRQALDTGGAQYVQKNDRV